MVYSENFVKDCTYPWNPKNTGCGGGFPGKFYDMLAFNETQRVADRAKYPPYKPVVSFPFIPRNSSLSLSA